MLKPVLMLLPLNLSKRLSRRFIGLSNFLLKLSPGIEYDLKESNSDITDREYSVISYLNAKLWGFLIFLLTFLIFFRIRNFSLKFSLLYSVIIGFLVLVLMFFVFIKYPKILSGKRAELIEKNLVFALKDLSIQITSGVPTYNAFVNVAKSNYGSISKEFENIAKNVNSSVPLSKALEESAIKSGSEYYKKTMWQLINTMRAGASLKGALKTIINELSLDQKTKIKSYAQELNLWSLIYLLFAVAIPTIGLTLIIILSNFAGAGITTGTIISFITLTFIVQFIIIGFIKSRRPIINL